MTKTTEIQDLGYANGWKYGEEPEIIKTCASRRHSVLRKNIGRCLAQYFCELCGYAYLVDSSD